MGGEKVGSSQVRELGFGSFTVGWVGLRALPLNPRAGKLVPRRGLTTLLLFPIKTVAVRQSQKAQYPSIRKYGV